MNVAELLAGLGRVAPWDKAAGWDPVGLQIGDPAGRAGRVAVCHEVTEEVVARVEEARADLLVSYHPLLFRPTARLLAGSSPAGRALRLIRAGIALAVVHTNFDVAPGGTADALADSLGLSGTTGFGPVEGPESVKVVTFVPAESADLVTEAMAAAGGGIIGNYSHCSYRTEGIGTFLAGEGAEPVTGTAGAMNREPEVRVEMSVPAVRRDEVLRALFGAHPYEEPAVDVYATIANPGMVGRVGARAPETSLREFAEQAAATLGGTGFRMAGDGSRAVGRVAVVPGSGSSHLPAAVATGADTLVTGDMSHHRMVEATDRGLAVIDAGHVPTERPGVARLYALVSGIVPDAVDLTESARPEASR